MSNTYTLSLPQLAAHVQVSRSTLYRMIRRNQGPKLTRIGRRVLVRPEDVEAWLKQLQAQQVDAA